MESKAERHIADYGNLLLEISSRITEEKREFEFVVTDKVDGFTCWIGTASDLATAQSCAISEGQLFLDPHMASPRAPEWRSDAKPGIGI
ncbi:MAG TPA: hypothetical protein VKT81_14180 [Bryobacteraceae bacterium]|nr:hypothetical protein [Bryobacteraceae bacterium]